MKISFRKKEILSLPNDQVINLYAAASHAGFPVLFIFMKWTEDSIDEQTKKLGLSEIVNKSRKECDELGYTVEDCGTEESYELNIWCNEDLDDLEITL